jgi:phosphatidylserine decarboxylase
MQSQEPALRARLFTGLQYLLPQHFLSRIVLRLTRVRVAWFKNLLIRGFLRLYDVSLDEAAQPDPRAYDSFNAFFTRALRPGARSFRANPNTAVMPVDGTISERGRVLAGTLVQAKGMTYDTTDLLAGDSALAARFAGGSFVTVYLAPYDYHRIHMPFGGTLLQTWHVPGELFSVNATTTAAVPRVFARNERVICLFDTGAGPMAVVLVGALFVGSIELVWAGEVTKVRPRTVRALAVPDPPLELAAGDELGRFNMGSTVIVLFGGERFDLCCAEPSQAVRLGDPLARIRP